MPGLKATKDRAAKIRQAKADGVEVDPEEEKVDDLMLTLERLSEEVMTAVSALKSDKQQTWLQDFGVDPEDVQQVDAVGLFLAGKGPPPGPRGHAAVEGGGGGEEETVAAEAADGEGGEAKAGGNEGGEKKEGEAPAAAAVAVIPAVISTEGATAAEGEGESDSPDSRLLLPWHESFFGGTMEEVAAKFTSLDGFVSSGQLQLTDSLSRCLSKAREGLKEYQAAKTSQLEAPKTMAREVKKVEMKAMKTVKVAEKETDKLKSKLEMMKSEKSKMNTRMDEMVVQLSDMQATEIERDRMRDKSDLLTQDVARLTTKLDSATDLGKGLKMERDDFESKFIKTGRLLTGAHEDVAAMEIQMAMNDERKIAAVKEKIRVEALIIAREKEEEIHKNRMREGGCQASVTMVDAATFTEFLCPPSMSLRYTANALALNDKRKKFPMAVAVLDRAQRLRYANKEPAPEHYQNTIKTPSMSQIRPSLFARGARSRGKSGDRVMVPSVNFPEVSDDLTVDGGNGYYRDDDDEGDESLASLNTARSDMSEGGVSWASQATGHRSVHSHHSQVSIVSVAMSEQSDDHLHNTQLGGTKFSLGLPLSTPPPSAQGRAMSVEQSRTEAIIKILSQNDNFPKVSQNRILLEPHTGSVGRSEPGPKGFDRRAAHHKAPTSRKSLMDKKLAGQLLMKSAQLDEPVPMSAVASMTLDDDWGPDPDGKSVWEVQSLASSQTSMDSKTNVEVGIPCLPRASSLMASAVMTDDDEMQPTKATVHVVTQRNLHPSSGVTINSRVLTSAGSKTIRLGSPSEYSRSSLMPPSR